MDEKQAAQEWRAAYERVSALLRDADQDQLTARVPACPDWTVHDLLSHMVGLGRDTLDNNEAPDHNAGWTQSQVDARRDRSTAEVLTEWDEMADDIVRYVETVSTRPLGDVIIHEQDLRGALGEPGARDNAGLAAIRDRMAGGLAGAVRDGGLAPLRLESDGWTWASGDSDTGTVLRADAFDLTRALTGRRTADQLRSWVIAGDVEPYLTLFGSLPAQPLPE